MTESDHRRSLRPKRLLANGAVTWFRIAGTTAAKLLTTPLLLNALGVEGYGTLAAATSSALVAGFLTSALQTTSLRAIALDNGNSQTSNQLFNAILGMHLTIGVALFLIGWALGDIAVTRLLVIPEHLRDSARVVLLVTVGAIAATTMLSPYEALLQSRERFGAFAVLELAQAALLVPICLCLARYDGDRLAIYAVAASGLSVMSVLTGALIALLSEPVGRPRVSLFFNFSIWRQHGAIFSWSLFGSLSSVGRSQGLIILINVIGGPSSSASFAIANQLQGAVRQVSGVIVTVMAPRVYKNDLLFGREVMTTTTLNACRLSALVSAAIAIPLISELPAVLNLWLGSSLPDVLSFTVLLVLSQVVDQTSAGIGLANLAVGRVGRFQFVAGVLSLAGIPLGYCAGIYFEGAVAVLWVVLANVFLVSVSRLLLMESSLQGITRKWAHLTLLPLVNASLAPLIFVIAMKYFFEDGAISLSLALGLILLIFAVSLFLLGLNSVERANIRSLICKKSSTK